MYFFRVFIKELKRDMKKNPKGKSISSALPVVSMNHIVKRSPSEMDEEDDKFDMDDLERGDRDLTVDLPDEADSLLLDEEDAHNAPTL